jgi:hypothetical protein
MHDRLRHCLLLAGFTLMLGGCATLPPLPPAPTTDEIVQMSKDGIPPAEIIQRMEESRALYALKASELAKLRQDGVSDEVIDYMQQTLIEAERAREAMRERDRMWMYGYPYYPGYPWGYWRRPFRY